MLLPVHYLTSYLTAVVLLGSVVTAKSYCQPTQPCWPSVKQWKALNASTNHRLIQVTPLARPCYLNITSDECGLVQSIYYDAAGRTDSPGASFWTNYETCGNKDCVMDLLVPGLVVGPGSCELGRLSPYALVASSPKDISAAILFAKRYNIKVVIKNTGHDLQGRSSAPGSLLIWTHEMKHKKYYPRFDACGAYNQPAIAIGAGVQGLEAYTFADSVGVTIPGGHCPTVGLAGGWFSGGGYGFMTPLYGLGVDNVLQVTLVTADGVTRVLNSCSPDRELFWAIRGGGGGTWGVVTEVVFKVYPQQALISFDFEYTVSADATSANATSLLKDFITTLAAMQPRMMALNGSASAVLSNYQVAGGYVIPGKNLSAIPKAFSPLTSFFARWNGLLTGNHTITPLEKFIDILPIASKWDSELSGVSARMSSRLIPKSLFNSTNSISKLADAILEGYALNIPPGSPQSQVPLLASLPIFIVMEGPYNHQDNSETAIHSAWRDMYWFVYYQNGWTKNLAELAPIVSSAVSVAADPLRALTPGFGTYFNEADVDEKDWKSAFFGENYDRLLKVKKKYDLYFILMILMG
ncbi:FAD-binding domain-containing protein [Rhizoclosmatium globosum]|uniref:FAD-binding domain-containing protein n=1 Tax=Rhizoclosmatium globosum TaxID=329046 RepID=A0A1Y2BPR7_9FUNG|nr:FAD-binding domain-containing protein [Rhizoclosmatium globosum]|eukprot:ORY36743.1 FAD-binding domain-containing protein [Rhizoclosmatium globosum]